MHTETPSFSEIKLDLIVYKFFKYHININIYEQKNSIFFQRWEKNNETKKYKTYQNIRHL